MQGTIQLSAKNRINIQAINRNRVKAKHTPKHNSVCRDVSTRETDEHRHPTYESLMLSLFVYRQV